MVTRGSLEGYHGFTGGLLGVHWRVTRGSLEDYQGFIE